MCRISGTYFRGLPKSVFIWIVLVVDSLQPPSFTKEQIFDHWTKSISWLPLQHDPRGTSHGFFEVTKTMCIYMYKFLFKT
jgi:hypothetical protein